MTLMDKSRRDFMKLSAAGVFGASYSGWLNVLAARALAGTGDWETLPQLADVVDELGSWAG